ncbi:tetratricopeptide repeat protein [Crossiella sp. CA198]|uniref:tetratricopeptide repeat protein n=1 Tax=Crossiella sp. CA198 TaxID=3455607 RepID=UPI003F8D5251
MLWWRRNRGWALIVLAALAVAAVAGTAWLLLADKVAAAVVGLVTAVFGILAARGRVLLERGHEQQAALAGDVLGAEGGRLPRVREMDDPIALGVHRAAELGTDRVPGYVPRDIQDRLDAAVRGGGFVLIIGESTAGKTRAAYEAIRRLCPDHYFLAPSGNRPFQSIVDTVLELRRVVVWLNDIERYLRPDGLTVAGVSRMLAGAGREVLLLGTIRTPALEAFGARREAELDGDKLGAWRTGREVLNLATEIPLSRRWSPAEVARAGAHTDPRLRAAAAKSGDFGVAELLADGPELANDWRNAWRVGGHPRGAALVTAAVDCRRAGLPDPMPRHVLTALAEHYLTERGGAALRPEPVEEAFAWAVKPARATSSLLLPGADPEHYRAFDYLLDLPDNPPVPTAVWRALIEWATPVAAVEIGHAARRFAQFDRVREAFGKGAEHGVPGADVLLADEIGAAGDPERALRLLRAGLAQREAVLGPDHPETLRNRITLLRWAGSEAEFAALLADCERVLGPRHRDTLRVRRIFAAHLAESGRIAEAIAMFEALLAEAAQVWGPDHVDTFAVRHQHATWLGESGDFPAALARCRALLADRTRVFGPEHPNVLSSRFQIGVWTGRGGQEAEAAALFTELVADSNRILGPEHPHTVSARYRLAINSGNSGDPRRAAELLTEVVRSRSASLGPDHTGTLNARLQLANYQHQAGFLAAARETAESLALSCTQVLGPDAPFTRRARTLRDRLRD